MAALVASLLPGVGTPASPLTPAAAGPTRLSAQEAPDTVSRDTASANHDSAVAAHEAQLDSLRRRVAALRAELLRLRVRFGARIERTRGSLRIEVPVTEEDGGRDRWKALGRFASVARRYYPDVPVLVLATAGRRGEVCGTPPERRRADAAIRYLTGPGGLDEGRVRRGDCARLPTGRKRPAAQATPGPSGSAVTLIISFRDGTA